MSIVYRSIKGSKLTSAEVDGNFQYLENLVGGQGNSIVTENGFTLVDQDLTIAADWVWKILNISYTNSAAVVINIPFASSGNQRIDLIVANQSNTFERIAGVESASNPSAPAVPLNKIFVTFITVTDGVIDEPETPIVGTQFKQKIENTRWKSTQSGSNVVIPFQAAGQMHYSVVHSGLISVAGFSTAALTTPMYEGQDVLFENQTGNPITLKDSFAGVNTPFDLGADLVVPNEGKIWFRSRNGLLEMIMKSWSDVKEVIEGYFNGTNFYTDALFTNLITPESGRIYVTLDTNLQYRWSGSAYVQIGGGGSYTVIAKNVIDSTPVTGTTANTTVETFVIPANTFQVGDVILFRQRNVKTGIAGAMSSRSVLGGVWGGNGMQQSANNLYGQYERTLVIKSPTNTQELNTFSFTSNIQTVAPVTYDIDWSINQNLEIRLQLVNATDSAVVSYWELSRIR